MRQRCHANGLGIAKKRVRQTECHRIHRSNPRNTQKVPGKSLCGNRRSQINQPRLHNNARQPEVKHQRRTPKSQCSPPRKPEFPEKQHTEQNTSQKNKHCRTIRKKLTRIIHIAPARSKRLPKNRKQMISRNPQPPYHKCQQATKTLPSHGRMIRTPRIRRPHLKSQTIHQPHLQHHHQMEKPDAEQHIGLGKITKRNRHRIRLKPQIWKSLANENLSVNIGLKRRNQLRKPRSDIPGKQTKNDKKPDLKTRIAQQIHQRAPLPVFTREFQKTSSQGKRQTLVIHPLPPKNDHKTQIGRKKRKKETAPPEKRNDPTPPGKSRPCRQPLVKSNYSVVIGNNRPVGQTRKQCIGPAIFRRGKINRCRNHAEKISRKPLALRQSGNHPHQSDENKLRRRKPLALARKIEIDQQQ